MIASPEAQAVRKTSDMNAGRGFEKVILRLVKGGPERRAIDAGQIDAIVDPASGQAILLPEGYCGIARNIAQRKADAMAQSPDRRARAALDALAIDVAVLDSTGVVLLANKAWRAFAASHAGIGAGASEGDNYLAACDDARGNERIDGVAIAAGIRQVIAAERGRFHYEYTCDSPAGRRWFTLGISGVAGGAAARAVVSREDITESKRAGLLLELEYAVARCLAGAGSAGAAVKSVIRVVCETQGWDCGRYFRLDAAAGLLSFHESWGVPAPAVEKFLEKSRGMVFRLGAGLKGRVCQSGHPLWVIGGTRSGGVSPTALAPETDADGAFVFPVLSEDDTIGVLAFSGRNIREPDDRMLRAVRAIGRQLGGFLERQQAGDALRQSEARFRRLIELSTDWYWEQDRDFRFTQLVGSGILGAGEVLGKTYWELPNVVLGEARWIEHQSQLAAQWSFCDFEFAVVHPDGQLGYYCISGEPVYDDAGTFTGYRGTGLDVTRRKRAECEARLSLRQTQAVPG